MNSYLSIFLASLLCPSHCLAIIGNVGLLYSPLTKQKIVIVEDCSPEDLDLIKQDERDIKCLLEFLRQQEYEVFFLRDENCWDGLELCSFNNLDVKEYSYSKNAIDDYLLFNFGCYQTRFFKEESLSEIMKNKSYYDKQLAADDFLAPISIAFYLDSIDQRCRALLDKVNLLPEVYFKVKNQIKHEVSDLNQQIQILVERAMNKYALKETDHIGYAFKYELTGMSVLERVKAHLSRKIVYLWYKEVLMELFLQVASKDKQKIIVQGSNFHAKLLLRCLIYSGFKSIIVNDEGDEKGICFSIADNFSAESCCYNDDCPCSWKKSFNDDFFGGTSGTMYYQGVIIKREWEKRPSLSKLIPQFFATEF